MSHISPNNPTHLSNAVRSESLSQRLSGYVTQLQQGQRAGHLSQQEMASLLGNMASLAEKLQADLASGGALTAQEEFRLQEQLDAFGQQASGALASQGDGFMGANPFTNAVQSHQLGQLAQSLATGQHTAGEAAADLRRQAHISQQASHLESYANMLSQFAPYMGPAFGMWQQQMLGWGQQMLGWQQGAAGGALHHNATNSDIAVQRQVGGGAPLSPELVNAVRTGAVMDRLAGEVGRVQEGQFANNVSTAEASAALGRGATIAGGLQSDLESGGVVSWQEERQRHQEVSGLRGQVGQALASMGDGASANPVLAATMNGQLTQVVQEANRGRYSAGELAQVLGTQAGIGRAASEAESLVGSARWAADFAVRDSQAAAGQQVSGLASNSVFAPYHFLRTGV